MIKPQWMSLPECNLTVGSDRPLISHRPYLICRFKDNSEQRAQFDVDYWGVSGWIHRGQGKYIWHCGLPNNDRIWIHGDNAPATESKVLVSLECDRLLTYDNQEVRAGIYFGRCKPVVGGYEWRLKVSRVSHSSGNPSEYHRVLSRFVRWLPLPGI